MASWTDVIDNPDERKVFEALADPKWDFRTVDGIRKATIATSEVIIPATFVERFILDSDLVYQSLGEDRESSMVSRASRSLSRGDMQLKVSVAQGCFGTTLSSSS